MLHFLCQQGKANKSASRLSDLDILWIYQEMILRLTGQNDENIVFFLVGIKLKMSQEWFCASYFSHSA